jgi:hypothetical protein
VEVRLLTRARVAVWLLAVLVLPFHAAGAQGVPGQVFATGTTFYPGDDTVSVTVAGEVHTLLVLPQGSELTFTNIETSFLSHSFTSDAYDVNGPNGYLFDTGPTLVNFRQSVPVAGVSTLAPGLYGFHCRQISHGMHGYLQIV